MKKSFALLTTLLLVILFSFISIRLVETNILGSNLNKLKYLHLQATIYMDSFKNLVQTKTALEITEYINNFNDERFIVNMQIDDTNSSIYYISIEVNKTLYDAHVRLSQKIIK